MEAEPAFRLCELFQRRQPDRMDPHGGPKPKKTLREKLRRKLASEHSEHIDLKIQYESACNHLTASRYVEFINLLESCQSLSTYQCPRTGSTLLHSASMGADLKSVQRLLQLNANPNACELTESGRTPLMYAVQHYAPLEIVTTLLTAGAKANFCANKRSIISYASRGIDGNLPVLQALLQSLGESKATKAVNYLLSDTEPFKTALDFAQNPKIRKLLIEHGGMSGADYVANLRNEIKLSRVGETLIESGYKPKYPCIILPGACSSALELWKSNAKPDWVNSRIWLDPAKLGLKIGLKLKAAEDNAFLEHMRLEDDGISDPPGISIRPVEGIHGIDYLMDAGPSVIIKQSVVWGEFISVLAEIGYTSTNLVGFSYDWRLAPEALQRRDKICLKLKFTIQHLVAVNQEKVALVGHSQGCKFGQFFLHWAEDNLGKEWIDNNIQMFIPMGAPWAGAPKVTRTLLSGDSMGLPTAFLFSNRYLVSMSRTFSGYLWLLPFGEYEKCIFFKDAGDFTPHHWNEVLSEHNENFNEFMKNFYESSNYLFSQSSTASNNPRSLQPPYVNSLHCIYGVNAKELPNYSGEPGTEIGALYELRRTELKIGNKTIPFKLSKTSESNPNSRFFVKEGIRKERPLPNIPSGDGTVPYESLSWSKKWIGLPNTRVIKHYEFDGACHRETLLEPGVLALVGELLCGGNPEEIFAGDQKIDTIFNKSFAHVQSHLSDSETKIPFIVSSVVASLYATNSVSQNGIFVKNGDHKEVERWSTVFLSWKKSQNPLLNDVYPHTRAELLKRFLQRFEFPLISMDSINVIRDMQIKIEANSVLDEKISFALCELINSSSHVSMVKMILGLLHDVVTNPVNNVTMTEIVKEFRSVFFWPPGDDKLLADEIFACLVNSYPSLTWDD